MGLVDITGDNETGLFLKDQFLKFVGVRRPRRRHSHSKFSRYTRIQSALNLCSLALCVFRVSTVEDLS